MKKIFIASALSLVLVANQSWATKADDALSLLQQSDSVTDVAEKATIFSSAKDTVSNLSYTDSVEAHKIILNMLSLVSNTDFQKNNTCASERILSSALVMSGKPNIVVLDPNLHNKVYTESKEFSAKNTCVSDSTLSEQLTVEELLAE